MGQIQPTHHADGDVKMQYHLAFPSDFHLYVRDKHVLKLLLYQSSTELQSMFPKSAYWFHD
ncbi:hypothetical protein D3C71_1306530 [compost metagenome]